MSKVVWLLVGILIGLAVSRTPLGRAVLAAIGDGGGEFAQTLTDSYRARRDELAGG